MKRKNVHDTNPMKKKTFYGYMKKRKISRIQTPKEAIENEKMRKGEKNKTE